MDSPAQGTMPLSPKNPFLAIFGPTPSLPSNLMRPCDGGDGSEDEAEEEEEEEGEEDEYEDEDDEGSSSFRSSNSSSLGTKLSLLESIVEEEDSSLAKAEIERIYPLIESSPEESRNEGYFGRAFSEKTRPLVPFCPSPESSSGFAGVIDSDTDHFGRPRTASRPNTPDGSKKIEFIAAQSGCIDCIIGIAGHHHGSSSSRTSPAPTPTLSRSSSLKLKEPALTPVEEESPQGIIERRERAEVIEATTAKLTNLTTLTPDTTPLKSSFYFAQQQLANGPLTPETTPLRYTAPQQQPQVLSETNSSNDPMPPTSKIYSPPERPKLITNYPVTPARRSGGAQIPPTPPTTPARRKSLLYSRENSRESISITGTSTNTSSKDVAPTGTITPPPSEAASVVEAEETKIEERKVEEEKPTAEAPKIEEPDETADSESRHGHGHDGHDCPYLRRSASPRPSSLPSYSHSYSVPSTPEPARQLSRSYSSPEVKPFTTHFHSGPSTPAPPVSRLSYSLPGTPQVSSSSYTNLPPKAPDVSRLISQEFARPSTPEVVFSGSGTASPFMDISEPASRAPSPPPPSLAGGSAITTPASSIFLPTRGPLAPAINLKDGSGVKSVSRSVSTSDFFPEQISTATPPAPAADAPATLATREPEKQPSNLLSENITVEVIHRLPFLTLPSISPAHIVRRVAGPVHFASNAVIIMWLTMLPLTLLIWTVNGIAQLFVKPEVGSPMAGFNPAWALVPYLVLFAAVAVYHRGEGLKGGEGRSEGNEEEISEDFLDYFLDKPYAVAAQLRGHFTPRRIRRFTISLLFAASLIASYFALQYLAPHIAILARALSSRIFSSKTASPSLAPTAPTLGPWEDMDFMYFVPSTSTSEQSTSSGMENAYGEYYPGANALEEELQGGLGWKGVLRLAAVLVMGPAGAVAVRRRTL